MSVNKFKPHVLLIPEDDANRQLARGFLGHDAVHDEVVKVRGPAGGWSKVLEIFETEYLALLRQYPNAHVVMLIDFDEATDRRNQVNLRIPNDVRSRVFVVGSKDKPETLKVASGLTFEEIGRELAQNCLTRTFTLWDHPHLVHNSAELQRMADVIRPFLFWAN